MTRRLARLELIEATGMLDIDVGWVKGTYQRILFHGVRTASVTTRSSRSTGRLAPESDRCRHPLDRW